MSFEIYFDESHKLDKYTSNYSYYGIIGWDKTTREKFNKFIEASEIYHELHFSEFKLDQIDNYLKALEYSLDKIESNFYIIDTEEAFKICDRIGIDNKRLRNLFYIKIPERLIYGITRKVEKFNNIDIYIDKSNEYGSDSDSDYINEKNNHIELPKTLKFQLNAQSIYRGLNYSINKVNQIDSKKSKSLQIIDVLLGILVFLFEERYIDPSQEIKECKMEEILQGAKLTKEDKEFLLKSYRLKETKDGKKIYLLLIKRDDKEGMNNLKEIIRKVDFYSTKSIQRSELIYRLLSKRRNLQLLYKLSIFLWGDNKKEDYKNTDKFKTVIKEHMSKYISQFFQFKMEYDNLNRLDLIKFHIKKGEILDEKEYTNHLGFGSSMKLLTRRYLQELDIHTK